MTALFKSCCTRQRWLLLFFLCLFSCAINAQRVQGIVRDTSAQKPLGFASVSLLQPDSVLVAHCRTDAEGRFQTRLLPPGSYILLISYPSFADLSDKITVTSQDLDLRQLSLTPKSKLLTEVIVRANAAIRLKGDTTEFAADSFRVREGATVEELLKRLPGFSVDAKGQITTQGKRVDKVLVDGEEFFGDDPTMATQNLSARIVDKVQVYDTKSEQDNIKGISSGNEGKTLNIKLKDNMKKGSFGKLVAGSDATEHHEGRALFNHFKGKKKVSAYATHSTVNTGSLNWQESEKLGIDRNSEYDEVSGYYMYFGSGDDDFDDWNLQGRPESYTSGALFSNRWNEDRQGVNLSYRFNHLGRVNEKVVTEQNILPGSLSSRLNTENTAGVTQQHALNGRYEWKPDSVTSIKLVNNFVRKTGDVRAWADTRFANEKGETVNTSAQQRANATAHENWETQLTWKQLSRRKKDRMLLTTLRHGITSDRQDGTIVTDARFSLSGRPDSLALIDQLRDIDGRSQTIGGKMTFSEPLSNAWTLVAEYGYNQNNSFSYRHTRNKGADGKYGPIDTTFSNDFTVNAGSHTGTLLFKYQYKKLRMAAGSGFTNIRLRLHNLFTDTTTRYHFNNLMPQASISFRPTQQRNFSLSYRGNTRQPNIGQLQPIRDNSDPLNVFIGNPALKVGFSHSLNFFFNEFKPIKGQYMYANLGLNFHNNAITFRNDLDLTTGKQTYSPINVNGNRDWWFWGSFNAGEGERKFRRGVQLNGNGSRNVNVVNGRLNVTDFSMIGAGPSFGYSYTDHYQFNIRPTVNYHWSGSTLDPERKVNYFTWGGWFDASVHLPGKFEFNVDGNIDIRQKVAAFAGTPDNIQINAGLSRKVFKKNTGKLMFTVNDLLNQNVGFQRNINTNFINEQRFTRIARYFMLRFEWSFNKMPGGQQ